MSHEVAHYEPPHQDLCCLQIQLFSSLLLKELMSCNSNAVLSLWQIYHELAV